MSQRILWITGNDATDHAVKETAHEAGVASATGEFEAVCGVQFLVAPMAEPPGKLCPRCRAFLHTRAMTQRESSRRPKPNEAAAAAASRLRGWWQPSPESAEWAGRQVLLVLSRIGRLDGP